MSFNFMAAVTISVILEPKKRKFVTVSIVPASICYEAMEQDAVIPVIDYLFIKNNPKERKDRFY